MINELPGISEGVYIDHIFIQSETELKRYETVDNVLPELLSDHRAQYGDYKFKSSEEVHEHSLTPHAKVEATCKDTGMEAYWSCSCGKLFADADGNTEVALADLIIPVDASNHTGGTEIRNAKAATATEQGYTGDTYCLGCGAKLSAGTVIPATGSGSETETGSGAPKTGDNSNMALWMVLLLVCGAAIVGVTAVGVRRKRN